jgi:valyl-tRNA synthetase
VADRIGHAQHLITEVRRFRADQGLRPSVKVPATLTGLDTAGLAGLEPVIRSVVRLTEPAAGFASSVSVHVAVGPAGQDVVNVDLDTSGTVDIGAEIARLKKDLTAAQKEIGETSVKLDNSAFTDKAPVAVVDKIRARVARARADIERITARLTELGGN